MLQDCSAWRSAQYCLIWYFIIHLMYLSLLFLFCFYLSVGISYQHIFSVYKFTIYMYNLKRRKDCFVRVYENINYVTGHHTIIALYFTMSYDAYCSGIQKYKLCYWSLNHYCFIFYNVIWCLLYIGRTLVNRPDTAVHQLTKWIMLFIVTYLIDMIWILSTL